LIMAIIRQQAIKKIFVEQMRQQQIEETKNNGGKKVKMRDIKAKMMANAMPIDLSAADQDIDNLVTYKEFMSALKGAKDDLIARILPRTLSFVDVLNSLPSEAEFTVTDLF